MGNPLVSVIVLCFNHGKYVQEAIESVIAQNYNNIEIIVADDASNDESKAVIEQLKAKYDFTFLHNSKNLGNCSTFNQAFSLSQGGYIIDLAADDILLPDRIAKGLEAFEDLPNDYGVHFSDVAFIDDNGKHLGTQYKRDAQNNLIETVPDGWVFKDVLEKYFISPPSMMMKREVLEKLGGYDENLSYEDFDFWIRSAREFKYVFTDEVLVKKRILNNSLSAKQKSFRNKHLKSTVKVCEKAFLLCKTQDEYKALKKRIKYELKWALWTGNMKVAIRFLNLLFKIQIN